MDQSVVTLRIFNPNEQILRVHNFNIWSLKTYTYLSTDRLSQATAKNHTQDYFNRYPELKREDVTDYVATQTSKKTNVTPEKLFSKTQFGE